MSDNTERSTEGTGLTADQQAALAVAERVGYVTCTGSPDTWDDLRAGWFFGCTMAKLPYVAVAELDGFGHVECSFALMGHGRPRCNIADALLRCDHAARVRRGPFPRHDARRPKFIGEFAFVCGLTIPEAHDVAQSFLGVKDWPTPAPLPIRRRNLRAMTDGSQRNLRLLNGHAYQEDHLPWRAPGRVNVSVWVPVGGEGICRVAAYRGCEIRHLVESEAWRASCAPMATDNHLCPLLAGTDPHLGVAGATTSAPGLTLRRATA